MIRFPELPVFLLALLLAAVASQASCDDAREIEFLRGLNGERQYALAAFQAEIDRRGSDTCAHLPEIDLELGKALYQLGAFPRVREILEPHLRQSNPIYRRYYLESYLLDFSRPRSLDSCLALLRSPIATEGWPREELRVFEAATLFTAGRGQDARATWRDPAKAPGNVEETLLESYLDQGFKNPALAAGLSVLPGLGYFYAGQPGDGIFAFTLASLFYGVAAYYAYYDAPVRAWTFAGFGAVFHASNMYGAHRAAVEINRKRKVGFLVALHKRLFP
jgi:hypothetical protein